MTFATHLDIYYVYMHSESNVSRKAKTSHNLKWREYYIRSKDIGRLAAATALLQASSTEAIDLLYLYSLYYNKAFNRCMFLICAVYSPYRLR